MTTPTANGILSTARGGHIWMLTEVCPSCGTALAKHQMVNMNDRASWFPLRLMLCPAGAKAPPVPEV